MLVRRLEEKETAKSGIIIPDTAKEKPQEGEVIAAGSGKFKEKGGRIPLDVEAGDRILFGKYTGNDITIDGEEYLILREEEICARSVPKPYLLSSLGLALSEKQIPRFVGSVSSS